jgi:hypothetical protein
MFLIKNRYISWIKDTINSHLRNNAGGYFKRRGIPVRIVFHHRLRVYQGLILAALVLGGLLLGGISVWAAEDEPEDKPDYKRGSLMAGYAMEEGAVFDGTFRFSPSWQLNLSRLEERLQLRAAYLPVPNLSLQAGYDFTTEEYLAGMKYRGVLGENTAFLADATGYYRQEVNEYLLDYQCDLEIGIGKGHFVFAGIRGEFIPNIEHDPEIYIKVDLNWDFGRNWHLRLEPLVLVEGRIEHKTTLSRKWANGVEAGIYCKNEELRWDAGIFIEL